MATKMREWKHEYVVSSERAYSKESDISWYTDKEYKIGEWITDSEGLRWIVLDIVK